MPVNGSTTPTFTSCACAMQAEKASAAEAARTRLNIHFLPKILETRAGNSGGPVSGRIVGRKPETGQANGPPERPVTMRLFGAFALGSGWPNPLSFHLSQGEIDGHLPTREPRERIAALVQPPFSWRG